MSGRVLYTVRLEVIRLKLLGELYPITNRHGEVRQQQPGQKYASFNAFYSLDIPSEILHSP